MASANLMLATENYPQVLVSQYLLSAETSVFQASANTSVAVATASVCNSSGVTRTVYLSVVKSGGTAGGANRVAIIELAAGESCVVEELAGLLLKPADFVSGYASASSAVSLVITGAVSS